MKFLLATFLLFANLAFQQEIDINALKKDPIMIQYKKILNELKDASATRKYKLPANVAEIQRELAKNPSKENMKKLYKEAGMKNADEYVDKLYLQSTLMVDFLNKHPEIMKLGQQQKFEIIGKLLRD